MQKHIVIEGYEHPVLIQKRKGTRNLRISLKNDGIVRLSVPYGIPEIIAKRFLLSKLDWVNSHLKQPFVLHDGQHIGKSHFLRITRNSTTRTSTKIIDQEIRVSIPNGIEVTTKKAQDSLIRACEKALKIEGENLLPQRLAQLSDKFSLPYKSLEIKKMRSRWGACDTRKNITLNIFLMQLPWQQIDYVLCHELAHTIHPHHQPAFWELVSKLSPDYKTLKKSLKDTPTTIISSFN